MLRDPAWFERLWNNAKNETVPNPEGSSGALMHAFASALDADIVEYSREGEAAIFLLELGALPFKGMGLNVVLVTHAPSDDADSARIATLLADYREAVRSIGLCIHVVLQSEEPVRNPYVPSSTDIIYMAHADLERIFTSRFPTGALFNVIKRYMQLERLNPFNTTEVARGSMFAGRKKEVEQLVNDQSTHFLVMGARLIGKTSLMLRARDLLCADREVRSRVFYFDCSTWGGYKDCVVRLISRLEPKRERRADISLREVTFMLRRLSHDGRRPLLLFFDECDGLTVRDSRTDWTFMRLLEEASVSQWVRLVFAGFRDVQALRQNWGGIVDSPFLGGLKMLSLGPLSTEESARLLCDPLVAADIDIRDQPLVIERVLAHSAGQPFILQFYGEHLYRIASERDRRELTLMDVQSIEEGDDLSGFLMNHFIWNTQHGAYTASDERACVLAYAGLAGTERWSQQDFETHCSDHGYPLDMTQVTTALQNLVHAQILSVASRKYGLAFPLLRDILNDAYPDLDGALRRLREVK